MDHVFEPQSGACATFAVIPALDGPNCGWVWGEKSAKISGEARGEDVNMPPTLAPRAMLDLPVHVETPNKERFLSGTSFSCRLTYRHHRSGEVCPAF